VGFVTTFLLVIVVLPIAAIIWKSTGNGWSGFWDVVSSPQAVAVTIGSFHFDADVTFTRGAIYVALLFVTLPFVVRTVQPVLIELDEELEDASKSLGASNLQTFRRIVLPGILPGILSGVAMAFARAVGEIGAIVLIAGNLPFKTEVASIHLFYRIEQDPEGSAAIAVVLLVISFSVLLGIGALRWFVTRHERG
jgi:sulfate/thiosulfate transport system permease protein